MEPVRIAVAPAGYARTIRRGGARAQDVAVVSEDARAVQNAPPARPFSRAGIRD